MLSVESELMSLKDRALAATRAGDRAFFATYLAADAHAVTPGGVLDREAVLGAVGAGAIHSSAIAEARVVALGDEAGLVTYRARFGGPHDAWDAFVTTAYRRVGGRWEAVLYQQTRLPAARSTTAGH